MVWLGAQRGYAVDWVTQRWVQATGKRVSLAEAPWLAGPSGAPQQIGSNFFERWGEERGLSVLPSAADDGLLDGLRALAGPTFDPAKVHPRIDDFYHHTMAFDLRITGEWSGLFRPFGWLIARLFARRLGQLNLPLSTGDLEGGVNSRIVRLVDAQGQLHSTAWVRTSAQLGRPVFVGQYGITTIPGYAGPCIKVVFPLPNGNAIVVLRPRADPNGALSLLSDGSRFGDPGFYFTVVANQGEVWARHVRTMKEHLSLQLDGEGLEGQHRFLLFGLPFLALRYSISRK